MVEACVWHVIRIFLCSSIKPLDSGTTATTVLTRVTWCAQLHIQTIYCEWDGTPRVTGSSSNLKTENQHKNTQNFAFELVIVDTFPALPICHSQLSVCGLLAVHMERLVLKSFTDVNSYRNIDMHQWAQRDSHTLPRNSLSIAWIAV